MKRLSHASAIRCCRLATTKEVHGTCCYWFTARCNGCYLPILFEGDSCFLSVLLEVFTFKKLNLCIFGVFYYTNVEEIILTFRFLWMQFECTVLWRVMISKISVITYKTNIQQKREEQSCSKHDFRIPNWAQSHYLVQFCCLVYSTKERKPSGKTAM